MAKYLIFVTVALGLLLASISASAISVAFPEVQESFNTSLILAGWILSIYQLTATASMPLAGKAAEIFGEKRLFLISVALFTVGSLFCALAPNIELMILARLIQALGGGGLMPIGSGIVARQFPESRQQAIGLFSSIFPIGNIIGPNLGGWMTHSFGWESIFWFNLSLGAIVFLVSVFTLKPQKAEGGKMDLLGSGLLSGALCALMVALGQLGNKENKLSLIMAILLFIVAIVFIILFVRHEKRVSNPIIDFQVLREKPFFAANAFNFIFGVCVLGTMVFIPLYAVSIYNMSTLESGLIITPRSIGMILASFVTSMFLKRWGYRVPMLIGTALIVVCLVLLGIQLHGINIFGFHLDAVVLMIIIMLVSGIGIGTVNPAANNACIDLMPNRISTITGVRGMFRQMGGVLSISVTTLLLQNMGNMISGFRVIFLGMAVIMVVSLPLVFLMPSAPGISLPSHDL